MTATTSIIKITEKTDSSSYIGFTRKNTDNTTVTVLKALENEHVHHTPNIGNHPTYYDAITPIPVENSLITSRLPRHGEKISSAQILPPYLLYAGFGDHVMKNSSQQGPNDKEFMYRDGQNMETIVRKRSRIFQTECFYQNYINQSNKDSDMETVLNNFINSYKNQTIQYVTTVDSQNNIVTNNFYTRRIEGTTAHKFTVSSSATGTVFIYVEKGSCNVSFDSQTSTTLKVIVICDDGNIDVVSPGTRKLLLIGKANINITDGTNPISPIPNSITRVINGDVYVGDSSMVLSLPNYATFGISSRYGIQKIHDTEMYEANSIFYKFEEDSVPGIQRYNTVVLDETVSLGINEQDYLETIAKQFKYQYGVTYEVDHLKRTIKSAFWGNHYVYTSVARQLTNYKIQSLNVISEVFDTENYHETMAETFRVNEYAYAFAMAGKYITINGQGDIVFSTNNVNLEHPIVEYHNSIGETLESAVIFPNVLAVNSSTPMEPNGGSDPIYMGISKYRKLTVILKELRNTSVFIGSSSRSLVSYQPVGGKIISVDIPDDKVSTGNVFLRDYKIDEHGLHIRNKYPSKTTGFTLVARVKKTKKLNTVFHPRLNSMEYYRGGEGVDVMYQDENELIIRVENGNGDSEIMHLLVNGNAKFTTIYENDVEYKYTKIGDDYKLQRKQPLPNSVFEDLMTLVHDAVSQEEENVTLFVMFRSLLLTASSNFVNSVTEVSKVNLPYVAMSIDGNIQCVLSSMEHENINLPLTKYYIMAHDTIDISNLPYEFNLHEDHPGNPYIKTPQNMLIRKNDYPYVEEIPTGSSGYCKFLFLGRKGYDAYITNDKIQYLPSGQVYLEQQLEVHKVSANGFLETTIIAIDSAGKIAYKDFDFITDNSVNSVRFVDGGRRYENTLNNFNTDMLPMIRGSFETIIKTYHGLKITLAVEENNGLKISNVEREDLVSNIPATLYIIVDDIPYYFIINSGNI